MLKAIKMESNNVCRGVKRGLGWITQTQRAMKMSTKKTTQDKGLEVLLADDVS